MVDGFLGELLMSVSLSRTASLLSPTVLLSALCTLTLSCVVSGQEKAQQENVVDNMDETVLLVTAEFKDTNILKLPASVTLVDEATILRNNAHHVADVLNLAPNVNFATGASRGKFIQIRGVGERSEFTEPVNYSVGVVVDGIDMTGIASGATLLDTQQVEILRGPQGTLYGANGLAGLINLVSKSPTESMYAKITAGVEEFGGRNLGVVMSNAISENVAYRIAANHYVSDGYMDNVFLQRDDTNNFDELSLRGKLAYQASENLTITTNLLWVDIDNGYDAFSLDSNRTTYSDEPGYDRQKTQAGSVIMDWQMSVDKKVEVLFSFADSELVYGFDEDWSHTGICDNTPCDSELFGFDWWYSSFDNYLRDNSNYSADFRILSDGETNASQISWVAGIYMRDQQIDLVREYTFNPDDFSNQYATQNTAFYGQISQPFVNDLTLIYGLRFENQKADYDDISGISVSRSENFFGGKIALEYAYTNNQMLYGLISRGYKTGGFNNGALIPLEDKEYDAEFMWNYELGLKGNWLNNLLTAQLSAFYQDRKDIQSKQSLVTSQADGTPVQEGGVCPCNFSDYIQNAAQGFSLGTELEMQWRGWDAAHLYASVGLLQSEFDDFLSLTHIDADLEQMPPVPYDLSGRAVAHAPEYQAVLGANWFINQYLTFNTQVELKDEFYLSDRHQLKSDAYEIINLNLNYQQSDWQVNLFVRNLTDEAVQTRGFGSFGNDPRNFYETEAYFQFAAPRIVGINASVEF